MYELISFESFILALQHCRKEKNLGHARLVHARICNHGLDPYDTVANYIVPMFVDCKSLLDAQQAFNKLGHRNDHSWASIISGYIACEQLQFALDLHKKMQQIWVQPNVHAFTSLLKACGRLKDLDRGREIHSEILQKGLERDASLDIDSVDLHGQCDLLLHSSAASSEKNVESWTAERTDVGTDGNPAESLQQFLKTNSSLLTATIQNGCSIDQTQTNKGMAKNLRLGNSLMAMYVKCGLVSDAQRVFDNLLLRDIVSWNILIAGYAELGYIQIALKRFEQMRLQGILPDARSWTAVIAGYSEYGTGQDVLQLFEEMQTDGIIPDAIVFGYVLKACGNVGAIDKGRELHRSIKQKNLDRDIFTGSTLIDMYAKGGFLTEAREVFDMLPVRDVVAWNSMIKGYALNHESDLAIECFEDMKEHGVDPNSITFTCILTACSHAKLVFKGLKYFRLMIELYNIAPTIDHYTCMIDLHARLGGLCEAEKFCQTVPYHLYDEGMWAALLSACKTYGDVELGMRCFQQLIKINPYNSPAYVLMSDIYTGAGMTDDARRLEKFRKSTKTRRRLGSSRQ